MKLTNLAKLKRHGRLKYGEVWMAWDYHNEVPVPERDMRAGTERHKLSELAKWRHFQDVEMP